MSATNARDETHRPLVCVQGLGFVGAAMASAIASARDAEGKPCFSVVGVDLPTAAGEQRIESLNDGVFPFATPDEKLVEATARARTAGNLRATSSPDCFDDADVIVVDVNLDLDASRRPPGVDFTPFLAAIRTVAARMKPGALVIVGSTVPPGTCERVVAPELARVFSERRLPEDAFLLAHSCERVMPGEGYLASITEFWRVYAGHTPAAADACERFFRRVVDAKRYPLCRLSSTTASETAKVLENSYRAVNIAFIEEWTRFAAAVGVDLFEALEAIRVRPTHSNIRRPGLGVGGYCLTKDPLFAAIAARQLFDRDDLRFPFCESAIETNRAMPLACVDRLEELLGGSLRGKRVLVLGVAYGPDVADTRHSPSQLFVEELRRRGGDFLLHDPLVSYWSEMGLAVSSRLPPPAGLDAVVFAVPHRDYRQLELDAWLAGARPLVFDANAVLSEAQRRAVTRAGCTFGAIGRG